MKLHISHVKILVLAFFVAAIGIFASYQVGQADSGITADELVVPEVQMAPEFEEGDFYKALENDVYVKTNNGTIHRFSVELATRGDEQEKGLMFRQSMPDDHGMLFLFRASQVRQFWMKNTLIPLDIIFLEDDGRIQHIHHNAKPQDLSLITSGKPSKAVLEINGGMADTLGIEAGDRVHHSAFRNLNLLHN